MEIPKTHQNVMPYLMLAGANKFKAFVSAVFGAQETYSAMRDADHIMHAEVQLNGSTIMYCDATEQWKPQTANLFVYVEDANQTYQLALDNGASSVTEPADQEYGRSCGVTDPTGNVWWITSVLKK
ncbi:VOC family protein [Pontibacter qinzhouensis]|uniref:VOC family protein n=1 Tax=Pontibacter qinzhouensis TaxID=2603253 RepID=A0A5C8KCJ3_9BACT|nr:VOC family protein [Pontibacter qinzhouensis]TXK49003.1 VOC family protein [Pontibacter qinzhouensis]